MTCVGDDSDTDRSRAGHRTATHEFNYLPGYCTRRLELFVAELRSEGTTEDGEVEVAPLHGGRRATAEFHPVAETEVE